MNVHTYLFPKTKEKTNEVEKKSSQTYKKNDRKLSASGSKQLNSYHKISRKLS